MLIPERFAKMRNPLGIFNGIVLMLFLFIQLRVTRLPLTYLQISNSFLILLTIVFLLSQGILLFRKKFLNEEIPNKMNLDFNLFTFIFCIEMLLVPNAFDESNYDWLSSAFIISIIGIPSMYVQRNPFWGVRIPSNKIPRTPESWIKMNVLYARLSIILSVILFLVQLTIPKLVDVVLVISVSLIVFILVKYGHSLGKIEIHH